MANKEALARNEIDETRQAALLKRRTAMVELAYSAVEDAKAHASLALANLRDRNTRGFPPHADLVVDEVDNEMLWENLEAMPTGTDEEKAARAFAKAKLLRAIKRGERRRDAIVTHNRLSIACGDAAARLLREADMIQPPPTEIEAAIHDTLNPESPKAERRRELAKTWAGKDREQRRVEKAMEEVKAAREVE